MKSLQCMKKDKHQKMEAKHNFNLKWLAKFAEPDGFLTKGIGGGHHSKLLH